VVKKLSLVVLFGDLGRFSAFARLRLQEATGSGIFSDVVFVINANDDDTKAQVNALAQGLDGVFTLAFNTENNIPMGRNLGIKLANGDSVFVWDDDDALIDPQALQQSYQFFVENELPIMEVPMVFPNGSLFHPGGTEIMPQISSGLEDLVLIGMMHSPFFLKKEVWGKVPMPEYVPLRGDWLHWAAMLWEAGIPVTCWTKSPVVMEGVREREGGATASGNGEEAKLQAYTSLIALFAIYGRLTGDDEESLLVKRRYFNKYCADERTWWALVRAGQAIEKGTCKFCCAIVNHAQDIVRERLRSVHLGQKTLKPFQAVMEPEIARAIFDKYRG
jgi:glycosyltransferase involved in cell wall biosynthesis